jgi:dihydroxyacetone kinase
MPGFSITLLLLPCPDEEAPYDAKQILGFLDDVPDVPGWSRMRSAPPDGVTYISLPPSSGAADSRQLDRVFGPQNREVYLAAIRRACEAVSRAEPELTKMDLIAGDGDCGLTLKSGATSKYSGASRKSGTEAETGILKRLEQGDITGEDVIQDVRVISGAVNEAMDGTSGALYS